MIGETSSGGSSGILELFILLGFSIESVLREGLANRLALLKTISIISYRNPEHFHREFNVPCKSNNFLSKCYWSWYFGYSCELEKSFCPMGNVDNKLWKDGSHQRIACGGFFEYFKHTMRSLLDCTQTHSRIKWNGATNEQVWGNECFNNTANTHCW